MDTAIKKRKVIDIPEDLLVRDVEDLVANMDDEQAYKWLSKHEPEGLVPASKKEQEAFRKWLGE